MYLKSLKLHGFKSFADKTMLEFHKGVTGVVGPNGCGKSNIVDAIRWVLGETSAKALRGAEMADVIFNGTDKRKPLGLAEVTLTFADCEESLKVDFNEVAITRRVYRDGRGEYLINNSLCRLRDIHELLMDTGIGRAAYSIMEQGKIDQLLSSKPEDRRAVFEEAAGITKFKTQKKEALRKLEYTEANLLRINDIIEEVKRQVGSAQRQAQKARRYQSISEDARVLDLHHAHRENGILQARLGELATSLRAWKIKEIEQESAIEKEEREREELRSAAQETEAALARIRQQAGETQARISSARNRVEFNLERNRELEAIIERHQGEIAAVREQLSHQEGELERASGTLTAVRENIQHHEERVRLGMEQAGGFRTTRQSHETALNEIRRQRSRWEGAFSSAETSLQTLVRQWESDRTRLAKLEEDATIFRDEATRHKAAGDSLREQGTTAENSLARLEEERRARNAALVTLQTRRDEVAREIQSLQKEATTKRSRLEVLRQMMRSGEGLKGGPRHVLQGLDDPGLFRPRIKGLLATQVDVPENLIGAIEASLHGYLDAILVSDKETGREIVRRLSEGNKGRVSLLLGDSVRSARPTQMEATPPEAIGWALDKITVAEPLQRLMETLLASTLIVPDLETAFRLRTDWPGINFATPKGEHLSADGILIGGSGAGEQSTLRREHEIRELEVVVAKAEENLAARERDRAALETDVASARDGLLEIDRQTQEGRVQLSKLQGALAQVSREWQQAVSRLESLQWENEQVKKRVETAEGRMTQCREDSANAARERDKTHEEEAILIVRLEESATHEKAASEALAEARTALAVERRTIQAMEEQQGMMTGRLRESRLLIERREAEITSHQEKITQSLEANHQQSQLIAGWEEEAETFAKEGTRLETERNERRVRLETGENILAQRRRQLQQFRDQIGKEELEVAKLQMRRENIIETVHQRHAMDLDFFMPDPHQVLVVLDRQKRTLRKLSTKEGEIEVDSSETPQESVAVSSSEAAGEVENDDIPEVPAALADPDDEVDWDEVASLARELRQRMESMGPVNLEAIKEFEELEERHAFLTTQRDDLVRSKEELLQVIKKINDTTRKLFEETFNQVRQNFRQTFRELFGQGAQADLQLIDEDDPLESGIEVIAKPPGKKLQSITLLSGGERSMTAVALLFSIYMVKPSPFCVLDELDAPLDEANIGRFLKMLDRFIEQSQFVIVTHNKRTMSRADIMYGVTMEEYGVSKPVGIRMTSEDNPDAAIATWTE